MLSEEERKLRKIRKRTWYARWERVYNTLKDEDLPISTRMGWLYDLVEEINGHGNMTLAHYSKETLELLMKDKGEPAPKYGNPAIDRCPECGCDFAHTCDDDGNIIPSWGYIGKWNYTYKCVICGAIFQSGEFLKRAKEAATV